jgi:hypothetical protein
MNNVYGELLLGMLYVSLREKYYPVYTSGNFNPSDFKDLGLYLQKEQVDPRKYFDYLFGMCEYQRPLKPKSMIDPILMLEFKRNT